MAPKRTLTILGFPKCGTTALIRSFDARPDCRVLEMSSGGQEIAWPAIRDYALDDVTEPYVVHKFVNYAYDPEALRWLAAHLDDGVHTEGIFVLCVRPAVRTLVSWHNMYRQMATNGVRTNHPAVRERDFFMHCTVDEFYERLENRLTYPKHLPHVLDAFRGKNLIVLEHAAIARDIDAVVQMLIGRFDTPGIGLAEPSTSTPFVGFADRADAEMSDQLRQLLENQHAELINQIRDSGVEYVR